jgi:hypothetical protein
MNQSNKKKSFDLKRLFLHLIYYIIIKTHLAYRTLEVAREREGEPI